MPMCLQLWQVRPRARPRPGHAPRHESYLLGTGLLVPLFHRLAVPSLPRSCCEGACSPCRTRSRPRGWWGSAAASPGSHLLPSGLWAVLANCASLVASARGMSCLALQPVGGSVLLSGGHVCFSRPILLTACGREVSPRLQQGWGRPQSLWHLCSGGSEWMTQGMHCRLGGVLAAADAVASGSLTGAALLCHWDWGSHPALRLDVAPRGEGACAPCSWPSRALPFLILAAPAASALRAAHGGVGRCGRRDAPGQRGCGCQAGGPGGRGCSQAPEGTHRIRSRSLETLSVSLPNRVRIPSEPRVETGCTNLSR